MSHLLGNKSLFFPVVSSTDLQPGRRVLGEDENMVNPTIIRGARRMTKVYIVLGEDAKHIHSVLSEDKVITCFQYPHEVSWG